MAGKSCGVNNFNTSGAPGLRDFGDSNDARCVSRCGAPSIRRTDYQSAAGNQCLACTQLIFARPRRAGEDIGMVSLDAGRIGTAHKRESPCNDVSNREFDNSGSWELLTEVRKIGPGCEPNGKSF